jgi:hypothetical protein
MIMHRLAPREKCVFMTKNSAFFFALDSPIQTAWCIEGPYRTFTLLKAAQRRSNKFYGT